MMKTVQICLVASISLALAACGSEAPPPAEPAAQYEEPAALDDHDMHDMHEMAGTTMAHASLAPTEGHAVGGELMFVVEDGAVRMTGVVTGLEPGSSRGFHIHETGDCSAPDASSAGGHFNPGDVDHGRRSHGEFHAGDMDNLQADDDGRVEVNMLLEGLELGTGGALDIDGKAVIVHVQADDYETQPTGDAGARVACGVIELHDH